ncbi:MAG: MarR family transcriptional regulator [Clostridia bacterium]|nr:MarR family transcriptional regulator [Clostridia bacterium]
MIEDVLLHITDKLRLRFYKRIFSVIREREGSLTAMEVFCVEIIHGLGNPTISEFAAFIGISRPAASYKVASLIQKGYIIKESSEGDKREFRLRLTDKYYQYIRLYEDSFRQYVLSAEKKCTPEQLESFAKVLSTLDLPDMDV